MRKSIACRGPIASLAAAMAIVVALALTSTAWAQSASLHGYGGKGGQAAAAVASSNHPPSGTGGGGGEAPAAGGLPFTGFDLELAAAGGLLLILAGAMLARFVAAPGRRA
jgi:hypothetical protein